MVFVCQTIRCTSLDFHIPHIPYSPGLRFVLPNMGIATCRVTLWRIFLGVTKNLFAALFLAWAPSDKPWTVLGMAARSPILSAWGPWTKPQIRNHGGCMEFYSMGFEGFELDVYRGIEYGIHMCFFCSNMGFPTLNHWLVVYLPLWKMMEFVS